MEVDRLSTGEKISAVSAVLLFIFMFFDWFGVKVSDVSGFSGTVAGGGSAWDALDVIPIFLMAAIVVAIAVAVIRLTDADVEPPFSLNTLVAVLGGLAVLLILYRIINPPGGGDFGGVSVDTTLKLGIFLGLIAAAGIAYGGYSAMREEGLTFGDAADRLGGGGAGAPPGPGGGPPPPPPPPAPGGQPPAQQPPQQAPPPQQPPPPPPAREPPPPPPPPPPAGQ
jgi:uncharacterized membrane protein YhaH (DUF805 family)